MVLVGLEDCTCNIFLASLRIDKQSVVPFGAVLPLPLSESGSTLPDPVLREALGLVSCYLGMITTGPRLSLQGNVNTKVM